MTEAMPLHQAKAHLSEVVDRVVSSHERVVITRHGRHDAVLMSVADLESLEETLNLLSDPTAVSELAEARAAVARGEGLDADQVRTRYLRASS